MLATMNCVPLFLAFNNLLVCSNVFIVSSCYCWKQRMGPEPDLKNQTQHHNSSTHKDINILWSSKELAFICLSYPIFSPFISFPSSHFLFLSFAQHIEHLWSEPGWGKKHRGSRVHLCNSISAIGLAGAWATWGSSVGEKWGSGDSQLGRRVKH